jgi:membrane protein
MLALVPFLGLVLTLAIELLPDIKGPSSAPVAVAGMTIGELRETMRSILPPEAYRVMEGQITRIQRTPPTGIISFGLAMTLWLASSVFVAIIDAMNRIYRVPETRPLWRLRLTAMAMTIVEAIILVGALVMIVVWPELLTWIGLSAPSAALAVAVQWVVVGLLVLLSFDLCLYVAPNVPQRWRWITPGSLAGTVAFLLASLAFRVYVQRFTYDKTYGSLGGVMALLFWFWLTSLVLLTAAQVNELVDDQSPQGQDRVRKHEAPSPALPS